MSAFQVSALIRWILHMVGFSEAWHKKIWKRSVREKITFSKNDQWIQGDTRKETDKLSFKTSTYSKNSEKFNVTNVGQMSKKTEIIFWMYKRKINLTRILTQLLTKLRMQERRWFSFKYVYRATHMILQGFKSSWWPAGILSFLSTCFHIVLSN